MQSPLICLLGLTLPLGVCGDERDYVTSSRLILGTDASRTASVCIGDVDGDSDLDIVVANGRHWPQQNVVVFNQGRARLNVVRPLGVDLSTSYAAELGDLDGDGDLDIVVGNDQAPNAVFLNDGAGEFRRHGTFGEPSSLRSLTLADIDGDGDLDILACCRGQQNRIYRNDGAANFPDSTPFGKANEPTLAVAATDVDGDGDLDLVLANRDGARNRILLSDGAGGFDDGAMFGAARSDTRAVVTADIDRDGHMDWAIGNIGEPNVVFFGDGRGGVRESQAFGREDGRTYALAIADMDQDGDADLVAGNSSQPCAVYFNDGGSEPWRGAPFGDGSEATYGVAAGDLNQDGFADIVCANSDAPNRVYLSRGKRSQAAAPTKAKPTNENWPQFRGPDAAGVADGHPLRGEWNANESSEDSEGVLWRAAIPGLGHSSPVIWGDRIFVCTAVPDGEEGDLMLGAGGKPTAADDARDHDWVILCFDKRNGEELWRRTAYRGLPRATRHVKATQANTSLVVDGERLVAFFGSEGLYCYDLDGELQWKRDLGVIDISKYDIGWGYSSSPVIHGDRIAIVCDDPSAPFAAVLRLSDGEDVWRVARDGISERSWGTPLVHEGPAGTQVVINGWPFVCSYDFESGEELWRIEGGGDNPIPTPFVANDWIYVSSSHGRLSPIYVVRPEARGDITPSRSESSNDGLVWSDMKGGSYMSTPVVYGDYIYLGKSSILRCFHAVTGESVYKERLDEASIIASLVAGDGKIYCVSEDGTVHVMKAGPTFEVIAKNAMGEPCFATPAISEGTIFLRTTKSLVAIR